MWSQFCGQASGKVFVPPKGLDERSLAIYCLECAPKKIRRVGYGMSWSTGVPTAQDRRTFLSPQSYRSLTGRFDRFLHPQAVNCQATIS
jgi:hypothetical protein